MGICLVVTFRSEVFKKRLNILKKKLFNISWDLRNKKELKEIISLHKPDVVFHLAKHMNSNRLGEIDHYIINVNIF